VTIKMGLNIGDEMDDQMGRILREGGMDYGRFLTQQAKGQKEQPP